MYSGFPCIHLCLYEIEMFMHALTYMHTSKRERKSWQGWCDNGFDLLLWQGWCDNGFDLLLWIWTNECLREILLTILKERPITLIPTIFACFLFFFLKKLSDLIVKISQHTYNSIYHIYILTTSFLSIIMVR